MLYTSYVSGTVQNSLHCLIELSSIIPYNYFPFMEEEGGLERFNNLPRVSELESS